MIFHLKTLCGAWTAGVKPEQRSTSCGLYKENHRFRFLNSNFSCTHESQFVKAKCIILLKMVAASCFN